MSLASTDVGFQLAEIDKSICDRFERMVNLFPERLAIKSQGVQITYRVLNQITNCLARTLLHHCDFAFRMVLILHLEWFSFILFKITRSFIQ